MILISKLLSEKDPQYNRKFKHCKSSMSKIAVHLICLISHARHCVGSRCPPTASLSQSEDSDHHGQMLCHRYLLFWLK